MKHPYEILIENLSKYSKILKPSDIVQPKPNHFMITDKDFNLLEFFNDVQKCTKIKPIEHKYINSKCADPSKCYKPYKVFGFDNVLFYVKSKDY